MNEKEFTDDELKSAINNFLWSFLPGSTSLQRAEIIACNFFDQIKQIWREDNQMTEDFQK